MSFKASLLASVGPDFHCSITLDILLWISIAGRCKGQGKTYFQGLCFRENHQGDKILSPTAKEMNSHLRVLASPPAPDATTPRLNKVTSRPP